MKVGELPSHRINRYGSSRAFASTWDSNSWSPSVQSEDLLDSSTGQVQEGEERIGTDADKKLSGVFLFKFQHDKKKPNLILHLVRNGEFNWYFGNKFVPNSSKSCYGVRIDQVMWAFYHHINCYGSDTPDFPLGAYETCIQSATAMVCNDIWTSCVTYYQEG